MLSAAAVLLPGCASLLPGSTWRVSRPRAAVRHGSVLAIEADIKDYVRPSGAPEVRAIDGLSDPNKPVLLYLPGIELSGYTLHPQTQELSEDFALHYLTVGQDDRTSFDGLVDVVCDAIDRLANEPVDAAAAAATAAGSADAAAAATAAGSADAAAAAAAVASADAADDAAAAGSDVASSSATVDAASPRPVYLLGESFGGVLGLAVALRAATVPGAVCQLSGAALVNPASSIARRLGPGST